MAELAFEDRLQPALLDRLSDDARSIPVVELRSTRSRLAAHGVKIDAVEFALRPLGLQRWRTERDAPDVAEDDGLLLQFSGPTDRATLARVRATLVAATPAPMAVERIAEVDSRWVPNLNPEPAGQRVISMRQLRESVLRDLAWLLCTSSYDTDRSLSAWPEVERSVFNFGLPSIAGIGVTGFDADAAARRLQKAIETFEPRFSYVRVTPEVDTGRMDRNALAFRVEAELWGQPTPQRLLLRTQIDVETADVVITDAESG
ncbi:MAG: type VI secretion system baseplate subunit TssE [Steroidobacteraceae bacterium]